MSLPTLLTRMLHKTGAVRAGLQFRDREVLLKKSELLELPETDVEQLFEPVQELVRAHVSRWGWFYPEVEVGLETAIQALRASDASVETAAKNSKATKYLKSVFRSYWEVDQGPIKAFDKALPAVLRYRLGLNKKRETFDISFANIRQGFLVQRHGVSFFRPTVAYALFRQWAPPDAVVWDPSCGFGARLLAFAAACPNGTYIGCEPATATNRDLKKLATQLLDKKYLSDAWIEKAGSERIVCPPESLDIVLTSPPYFDLERYFDEPGQCWRDYPSLPSWSDGYLSPTLRTAFQGLRPGGHAVLNINRKLAEVLTQRAEQAGFKLAHTHKLFLDSDHYLRTQHAQPPEQRFEPVFVFQKPS